MLTAQTAAKGTGN